MLLFQIDKFKTNFSFLNLTPFIKSLDLSRFKGFEQYESCGIHG